MEKVNIAILGHGVVGSGVAEVIFNHEKNIEKKSKKQICIRHILDLREFPELSYSNLFTKDFNEILNDDSVLIVVEVMGGIHPAYEYVKACLEKGKSVVTSNKELVAQCGAELLKIAESNNVNFLFEASVGGGIPVLRPIAQCLAANDLYEVLGILNGTTNFILTKMVEEQMPFEEALKLAQQLGYAEREPSADIDGHDACRKICILAALAFGKHVYPDQVNTQGIRNVTVADTEFAASAGYVVKLIGRAKLLENGHITAAVFPAFINKSNQLSGVDDVFNAIMVRGDAIGDVMFYGRGAGKLPTASAVVADVIDCAKHLNARKYLSWEDGSSDYVVTPENEIQRFYTRIQSEDINKAKSLAESIFKDAHFLSRNGTENEIAFITSPDKSVVLKDKIDSISKAGKVSVLRVLD